jgi:hypothetical protein
MKKTIGIILLVIGVLNIGILIIRPVTDSIGFRIFWVIAFIVAGLILINLKSGKNEN